MYYYPTLMLTGQGEWLEGNRRYSSMMVLLLNVIMFGAREISQRATGELYSPIMQSSSKIWKESLVYT